MVLRKANAILPTLKATDLKKPRQATIESLKDVNTKFGEKIVMTLQDGEETFQIFVNNYSLEKLNDAWGDDDTAYTGKLVDLKQEKDPEFNKEMIVIYPVK